MAKRHTGLWKAVARIKELEDELEKQEALTFLAEHEENRLRGEADEQRRRRLNLEEEFKLMGYKHLARRRRRTILERHERAAERNGRAAERKRKAVRKLRGNDD